MLLYLFFNVQDLIDNANFFLSQIGQIYKVGGKFLVDLFILVIGWLFFYFDVDILMGNYIDGWLCGCGWMCDYFDFIIMVCECMFFIFILLARWCLETSFWSL